MDHQSIGWTQGIRQGLELAAGTHGVGSRFQYHHQPSLTQGSHGRQGGAHGSGVMGKIIHHRDTPGLTQHLESPADALEAFQCGTGVLQTNTKANDRNQCCQGIVHVVMTAQAPCHLPHLFTMMEDDEGAGIIRHRNSLPGLVCPHGLQHAPATALQQQLRASVSGGGHDMALAGNEAYQEMEGIQVARHGGIDIEMIMLDGGQDQRLGPIV